MGSVSSLSTGFNMRLMRVKTTEKSARATQSVYEMLGRNQAKMKIANSVLINGRSTKKRISFGRVKVKGLRWQHFLCSKSNMLFFTETMSFIPDLLNQLQPWMTGI